LVEEACFGYAWAVPGDRLRAMEPDLFRDAIANAPEGEPFTAEQEAELAADEAAIANGTARLISHEDVPEVLAEMARTRAA
jgi:hypothetical protein